jgi:hypothetical protein
MKKILTYFQIMLMMPAMAIAQVADVYDSFPFRAREYFDMNIGWSLVSLILAFIGTLIVLILVRKKKKQVKASIMFGFIVFCVWYFYPAFAHKGTYTAIVDGQTETVVVDEVIRSNEKDTDFKTTYHVQPFHRRLLTDFHNPSPHFEHLPILLGWNKFYLPTWYEGLVEYKKVKTGEPPLSPFE